MSLRSMTGFGCGAASSGVYAVAVEVRTVNHRFLDVRAHLPREISAVEPAVVALARQGLRRGRVDVHVRLEASPDAEATGWRADRQAARALHLALCEVRDDLGLAGEPDLATLAALADRFLLPAAPPDLDALRPAVLAALTMALAEVVSARTAEGRAIEADLSARLAGMRACVEALSARSPEVVVAARDRLCARIATLLADPGVRLDPGRLEQEVALLADRSDVSEELQRLSHHLDTLAGWLDGTRDEPIGRQLDFLAQELGRESNTVASKVADAAVGGLIVELKAEIERVREQAANVE